MGSHRFLECGINITARLFILTDTFQPFTNMQVGRVVTFTAYIGVKQTALGKL